MRRGAALALLLPAACGDNGNNAVDAPRADAFSPRDAIACEETWAQATWMVAELPSGAHLDLDGVGTACEQVLAALPQLATNESMARLLAMLHDTSCADFGSEVDVTFVPLPEIDGVPILHLSWAVFLYVWIPTGEVFVSGTFLDITDLPPPPCLGELGFRDRLPGQYVHYTELTNCFQTGGGFYRIGYGDTYTLGDEVLWINPNAEVPFDPAIRRAEWVDVRLLPSHVTESMQFSDFMCCEDNSLVDCVGTRVLADSFTGQILEQARLCEPTCTP